MSDTPSVEPQPRHLSPWMVIGGITLLAVLAAAALAVVVSLLTPTPSPVPAGIAQAELADGSVLVLHDLTEGSNRLDLPKPSKSRWKRWLGISEGTYPFHSSSFRNNSLTIWLARYDARTGQPLEFDRWSHCIVRTAAGDETYDSPYAGRLTRQELPHTSTSSMSGPRPFAPSSPLEPGRYSHVLYTSHLPRVRSTTGNVEIDVYDADDGLVATLTAPLPGGATSYPIWTPEPLPATHTAGDVEVTLNSLTSTLRTNKWQPNPRPRQEVQFDTTITQDGEESALWTYRQITLADALGNESDPYDCILSPHEAAWKVRMRLFRSDEAALLQGTLPGPIILSPGIVTPRLVVEDIALPDDDPATTPNATPVGKSADINGVTVKLLGVGGPGKTKYDFKAYHTSRGTHSAGQGMRTEYDPPRGILTIDNDLRHVALQISGETSEQRLSLLLTDQCGVRLKTGFAHSMGEVRVWTFEPDEWVSAVNVYVTVQNARTVEFTVAPPVPTEAE